MSRAVAATVAAASLYSRLASFALLAIGARILTVQEFGTLAVAISLAVALANTFAAGAGDQLAAQAAANPRGAWNFLVRSSIVLMVVAALCSVAASMIPSPTISVIGSSVSICASTAICMTTMNYLRGAGRVTAGSLVAYVLLPTLRTIAVVCLIALNSTTLVAVMIAVNLASVVAAATSLTFVRSAPKPISPTSTLQRAHSSRLTVVIGTTIALGWVILGQGDVTALALFQGAAAAGQYTPTMRILEALTALGIGIKFAGTRQMLSNPRAGLRSRMVLPLLFTYVVSAVLCFLAAPVILALTFGEPYEFNYSVAAILVPAYFLSSLVTILLQILIARGSGRQVAVWTTGVIGMALLLLAGGAAHAGGIGVAIADLLVFATWFIILLKLEVSSRREDDRN